jgi:hypothetical protein
MRKSPEILKIPAALAVLQVPPGKKISRRRKKFRLREELYGRAHRRMDRQRRNFGEQTIFEAISEGDLGDGPFLFVFEEEWS